MQSAAGYYFTQATNGTLSAYGPFGDYLECAKAAYLANPMQDRDSWYQRTDRAYCPAGVGEYSAGEISAIAADPSAWNYGAVCVHSASEAPQHESWARLPLEFVRELAARDLAR